MANKGYAFEVEVLNFYKELEDSPDGTSFSSYRVYGSGRNKLSKHLDPDAQLDGDVYGKLPFMDAELQTECKHYKSQGKGRSFKIEKDWVDANLKESEERGNYSVIAIKFKNTKHNAIHYIIPQEHYKRLLLYIKQLSQGKTINIKNVSTEELLNEIKRRIK